MIFDTHAHLNDESFDADRDDVISSLCHSNVACFTEIGFDLESSQKAVELAERSSDKASSGSLNHLISGMDSFSDRRPGIWPEIYAAIGFHPDHAGVLSDSDIEELCRLSAAKKVVAIGEIGLDYHYLFPVCRNSEQKNPALINETPCSADGLPCRDSERQSPTLVNEAIVPDSTEEALAKAAQKECFVKMLRLAKKCRLPVVIHSREAAKDTFDIMESCEGFEQGGIMHCFSYSPEMALRFVEKGMYIGVGGVVTFKNARKLKDVVKSVPLSAIVLETDCPYMAPVPFRGKRNDPSYLPYVVSTVSEIKGISKEEVIKTTMENARRVYRIL